MVLAEVRIGEHDFTTALIPKDDTYLLPLKTAVRKKTNIALGDTVHAAMRIFERA